MPKLIFTTLTFLNYFSKNGVHENLFSTEWEIYISTLNYNYFSSSIGADIRTGTFSRLKNNLQAFI